MTGTFSCLILLLLILFLNLMFWKIIKSFRNTIRVPNSLGPDEALGQNCLQKFSENDKVAASKDRLKTKLFVTCYNYDWCFNYKSLFQWWISNMESFIWCSGLKKANNSSQMRVGGGPFIPKNNALISPNTWNFFPQLFWQFSLNVYKYMCLLPSSPKIIANDPQLPENK